MSIDSKKQEDAEDRNTCWPA